ncbi:hypothetical protein [Pedobacter africanus]|uniref:hypothetical protein n=1 Tax=Pedobacter africanus TaxID=151894 RepID=UPI000A004164|nr:hypothetical protein [Pedobacter africanus]
MKTYNEWDWEISMLFDRNPNGCERCCHCVHPAGDCGCADCQKRHGYRTYFSPVLGKYQEYRLN